MKNIWNVVSFLAVVHLLALLMFLAWLWQTDRLNGDRVEQVRSMLSRTIAEDEQAQEQEHEAAQLVSLQRAEQARRQDTPPPSAEAVGTLSQTRHADERAIRRINDVKQQLYREIALAEQQLSEQRAALDSRTATVEGDLDAEAKRLAQEQLTKAVRLLESLPPRQAKEKIVELVQAGKTEQAVTYLDAMSQRAAGKVLAQFKTPKENELATELLERIRTRGLPAASTEASDADDGTDIR